MGVLELLWYSAYEAASEIAGLSEDVAATCRWPFAIEILTSALVDSGFLDVAADGNLVIHNFWRHAPPWVKNKSDREMQRIVSGRTISQVRSEAGKLGAQKRWQAVNGNQIASCQEVDGKLLLGRGGEGKGRDGKGREETPRPQAAPDGAVLAQKPKRKSSGETPADVASLSDHLRKVVVYWQEKCSRKSTPTVLDIQRVQLFLADKDLAAEYGETPERIIGLAIKGCSLSPFHMGDNPTGVRYNDLALIFRDQRHVRQFVDIAKSSTGGRKNGTSAPHDPRSGVGARMTTFEEDENA